MCSYVLLIWLELITFVTLVANYLPDSKPLIHLVASLGFAVSSRELANQNLCKT